MDSSYSLPQLMLRQTPVDGRFGVTIESFELASFDDLFDKHATATKHREMAIPWRHDEPFVLVTEERSMLHAPRISI